MALIELSANINTLTNMSVRCPHLFWTIENFIDLKCNVELNTSVNILHNYDIHSDFIKIYSTTTVTAKLSGGHVLLSLIINLNTELHVICRKNISIKSEDITGNTSIYVFSPNQIFVTSDIINTTLTSTVNVFDILNIINISSLPINSVLISTVNKPKLIIEPSISINCYTDCRFKKYFSINHCPDILIDISGDLINKYNNTDWCNLYGSSFVTAILDDSTFELLFGRKKIYTYTYPIIETTSGNNLIDNYYKIFKLFDALKYLDQTLENIETTTRLQLINSKIIMNDNTTISGISLNPIYDDTNNQWKNTEQLLMKGNPLRKGSKKLVNADASGFFEDKRNMFGIYIGPTLYNYRSIDQIINHITVFGRLTRERVL